MSFLLLFDSSPFYVATPALAQDVFQELSQDLLKDRISAGDVLSIAISPGEEYSREVTVQPDGKIPMPLIGTVEVKGLSIQEAESLLQKRYSRYVSNPHVAINVRSFSGRKIGIIGQIRGPGYYPYRDGMKLLELVSLSGGFDSDARTSRIKILRSGPKGPLSFSVNFNAVLAGNTAKDIVLAPGDVVYVPQQPFTTGAAWVNRNVLPWAVVTSIALSIMIASRSR